MGSFRLKSIFKYANLSNARADLDRSIELLRPRIGPNAYSAIENAFRNELISDRHFSYWTHVNAVNTILRMQGEDPNSVVAYVEAIVERASFYNSEYLRSENTYSHLADGGSTNVLQAISGTVAVGHANPEEVAAIQQRLEDLGYPLDRYGVDGKFGPETEQAVILFQEQNNLSVSGHVSPDTLNKLRGNANRYSENARTQRRRERRERTDQSGLAAGLATMFSGGGAGNLSNITLASSRVDIDRASPMLRQYLQYLNHAAEQVGANVTITSAYRSPYHQARIMLHNYSSRGVGSARANSYLSRLYRRFPRIDDIIAVFAHPDKNRDTKISEAEQIIDSSWPRRGHLDGRSIDIRLDDATMQALQATQDMATVDILRESDHYHVTVRSLNPGGIARGTVRRFS
tara:strand:+ start:1827 stop:3035 length:1209 start_codon:yes stop_codon:yes gene_type:complete